MPVLGYARVSTKAQDHKSQVAELIAAGCTKVFAEKLTGADYGRAQRKQLDKLLASIGPGDTVVCTRLDRLARSTRDLLNIVHAITEAGAGLKSLQDSWCDTTNPHGKLPLTILGGMAEFERSLILSRTQEGRSRAKAEGKRFGRKWKLTLHQRREAIARRDAGESYPAIARSFNVSHSVIMRICQRRAGALEEC
jgi:DNA invertase Pin-like site-specific DNA recombinase